MNIASSLGSNMFSNKEFIEIFIQKMTYKDVLVIVLLIGLFVIFYFDYDFLQKLSHVRYLIIFAAGVGFMGYVSNRLQYTDENISADGNTGENGKKYIVNEDFDKIIKSIQPLSNINGGADIYKSLVKDVKKFRTVYNNALNQDPMATCNKNNAADNEIDSANDVWYVVKQAKKYKNRIISTMHEFPKSIEFKDKLDFQIQQMDITLNAYLRRIVRECDNKSKTFKKNRNLLTHDTLLPTTFTAGPNDPYAFNN